MQAQGAPAVGLMIHEKAGQEPGATACGSDSVSRAGTTEKQSLAEIEPPFDTVEAVVHPV